MTEPNLYALAQDVKHLSEVVDDMSSKADKRWETQQQIFAELASNKKEMSYLVKRVNELEQIVDSLNAWRWKTIGVLGVLFVAIEAVFKL